MKKILVSACLLGKACRYDGRSKTYPQLEALRGQYELIPFCPEEAGGLPTPRVPAEITKQGVFTRDGRDVTQAYRRGAQYALETARREEAAFAILKSKSPSCGKYEVYDGSFSGTLKTGQGITAALFSENEIPVFTEEEIEKIPL